MPSVLGIVASGYLEVATGPTFRSASTTTSASGSFTLAMPTGTAVGDVLIVQVWISYDPKSGVAGSPSAGWTQRGIGDDSNYPFLPWRSYSRVATGTDSFSWSGGSNWISSTATCIAISGGSAVDVAGTRSITAVAPSVTTTTAPTLLVGLFAVAENSISAPASMTARATLNTSGLSQVIATEPLTASGATGSRTCPTSSLNVRYSQLIAVK